MKQCRISQELRFFELNRTKLIPSFFFKNRTEIKKCIPHILPWHYIHVSVGGSVKSSPHIRQQQSADWSADLALVVRVFLLLRCFLENFCFLSLLVGISLAMPAVVVSVVSVGITVELDDTVLMFLVCPEQLSEYTVSTLAVMK